MLAAHTVPCFASLVLRRGEYWSGNSKLYWPRDLRSHCAMNREQDLIDALLAEIESMPIGIGGSVSAQYFFLKLNNISSDRNPGEFAGIESALIAVRQRDELIYPQGAITYHLKLLLEEGLIHAEQSETYGGTFIAVKGLTAQGHTYLDDRRKMEEGPLSKALNASWAKAPEWVARSLVTSTLQWALGAVGGVLALAATQIPAVKYYLCGAWFGHHQ